MYYIQLKKALYGTLQATLLFCKLLSNKLQDSTNMTDVWKIRKSMVNNLLLHGTLTI